MISDENGKVRFVACDHWDGMGWDLLWVWCGVANAALKNEAFLGWCAQIITMLHNRVSIALPELQKGHLFWPPK